MKAKYIPAILTAVVLLTWSLVSCNLLGVSIDQRVADLQSDLNTSDRSSAYQNFDPNMADYSSLKNGTYFSAFPVPPPNYTLVIISESNTSSVIVQVSTGNTVIGYIPPACYLNLNMTKDSNNNWLISTLSVGGTSSGTWSVLYQ